MSKRQQTHVRIDKDFYPTPAEAVAPLIHFLDIKGLMDKPYCEPCAGNGALIKHLEAHMRCVYACDIAPQGEGIDTADATALNVPNLCAMAITNPPFKREIMHPIINNLVSQLPCIMLIEADWAHTKQALPYMRYCTDIISVGRLKWFANTPYTSKDNFAWFRFDKNGNNTRFWAGLKSAPSLL